MRYFNLSDEAINHIKSASTEMSKLVDRIGRIERYVEDSAFECLASSIAGQQISGKALDTIWGRLEQKVGSVTPQSVDALTTEEIQTCGMSLRKAKNIKALAQAFLSGFLDEEKLKVLSDEQVVELLTQLDGIGKWTAEMFLIFCLERQDVLSYGDFGIRKGLSKLLDSEIDKTIFEEYRQKFSPYGTAAAFYLWALASEK